MRDFGGYSFGYSARDMQEEMTERDASSVILDIANKGADYVAIANAFEHIGAEFVAYLADLQAHHKDKDKEGWEVTQLYEENLTKLKHYAHFMNSGGYLFAEMLEDYREQIDTLAGAFWKANIDFKEA